MSSEMTCTMLAMSCDSNSLLINSFPVLRLYKSSNVRLEKMAKIAGKSEKDFRNNLKRVQSLKYTIGDDKQVSDCYLAIALSVTLCDFLLATRSRDPSGPIRETKPSLWIQSPDESWKRSPKTSMKRRTSELLIKATMI